VTLTLRRAPYNKRQPSPHLHGKGRPHHLSAIPLINDAPKRAIFRPQGRGRYLLLRTTLGFSYPLVVYIFVPHRLVNFFSFPLHLRSIQTLRPPTPTLAFACEPAKRTSLLHLYKPPATLIPSDLPPQVDGEIPRKTTRYETQCKTTQQVPSNNSIFEFLF
jgi:hypothetical protein